MTTAILVGHATKRVIDAMKKTAQAVKHDLVTIWNSRSEFVPNAHGGQSMNPLYHNRNLQILRIPPVLWNWL